MRPRGTVQVRPCKLRHRIHAVEGPATSPTPALPYMAGAQRRSRAAQRPALGLRGAERSSALPPPSPTGRDALAVAQRTLCVLAVDCPCPSGNCRGSAWVGWRDRWAPWMAPTSLQGWIHGVSRQPTHADPARPKRATTLWLYALKKLLKALASKKAHPDQTNNCRMSRSPSEKKS